LIGGVPLGGQTLQAANTAGTSNSSGDLALLQSLLPGVHITHGGSDGLLGGLNGTHGLNNGWSGRDWPTSSSSSFAASNEPPPAQPFPFGSAWMGAAAPSNPSVGSGSNNPDNQRQGSGIW
jgi:hypothetical protein